MRIDTIVIHYTASYADEDLTAADIDRMHRARGFRSIGYHWLIRRDGTVEKGRDESEVGAHVANQNTGKIGISWVGGLDRATGPDKGVDNRTEAQTAALIKLIRECLKRYPGAKVVGHRDLANTQCPGFDVPVWWAKVQKVKQPDATKGVAGAPARTGNIAEDKYHTVVKGETWYGIAKMHGIPLVSLLSLNDATDKDVLVAGRRLLVWRDKPSTPPQTPPKPNAAPEPPQGGFRDRFWAWVWSHLPFIGK